MGPIFDSTEVLVIIHTMDSNSINLENMVVVDKMSIEVFGICSDAPNIVSEDGNIFFVPNSYDFLHEDINFYLKVVLLVSVN